MVTISKTEHSFDGFNGSLLTSIRWDLSDPSNPCSILKIDAGLLSWLTKVIQWLTILHMITIVELPEFTRRIRNLLGDDERNSLIDYLAAHPASGVIIRGTGGIRKLRWRREGTGKSGGVRVIYYYYNDNFPLFLLTIFGKSEKVNLSQSERNELAKLTQILIKSYGDKS